MKTPSRTFAFVILAVIVIVAIVSCSTQLLGPNQNVGAIIGDPNASPPKYVELKNGVAGEGALRAALAKIKRHGGVCEISFLRHDGEQPIHDYCNHINVSLKTDRVIKSEAANKVVADNSAANDPNITWRISSPYPSDVSGVLDLLKP